MAYNRELKDKDREEYKAKFKSALKSKGYGYTDLIAYSGKSYGHIRNTLSTKKCLPNWLIDFAIEKKLFN